MLDIDIIIKFKEIEVPCTGALDALHFLKCMTSVLEAFQNMLTIKCAGCKRKLWKYHKVGQGKVLRCHKERITRTYIDLPAGVHKISCLCGKEIGIDKGSYIKMIEKTFTYSGTKSNR